MAPNTSTSYFQCTSNSRHRPNQRSRLREIAAETLSALDHGGYTCQGTYCDLSQSIVASVQGTEFLEPDGQLKDWRTSLPPRTLAETHGHSTISVVEMTTISAAQRLCSNTPSGQTIGILNFASAKKEGGGFINGAQAQEESIARTSTLYASLRSTQGQRFYERHRADSGKGYYSHSIIYTPQVVIIRQDDSNHADWQTPAVISVVTSAAVNAGVAMRHKLGEAASRERQAIEAAMRERMGRILFCFESKGVETLVLGSFGTGVFRNGVPTVAAIWKELIQPGSRFARSFRHITFAVIGSQTYQQFKETLGPLETLS